MDPFLSWKNRASKENTLYLTFDDGPHPEVTPWVLDELKRFNAKATFFCVGDNVRKFPEVYQRILDEGHKTGNHTFNHLNGWKVSRQHYLDNVDACRELVDSSLFRPPYGKISVPEALALKRKNYRIVMWSLLSRDFEPGLDIASSLRVLKEQSGNGSIVLFHDSEKAEHNLRNILPGYLAHFSSLGYQFATL